MNFLRSIRFQLGVAAITILAVLCAHKLMFVPVGCGLLISFSNTILDKFFIYCQQFSKADAGLSFLQLVLSVVIRLIVSLGGLYFVFTVFAPKGVIAGFVLGHVGYMLDKFGQINKEQE